MNSERRHQLQHNELADQIDKARHWLEPYLVPGLIAMIGITVVYAGYSFFTTRSSNQKSEATLELLFGTKIEPGQGEDTEAYERIAKDFPEQASARIATLLMADQLLQRGNEALFRDRDEAKGLLTDAEDAYRKVLQNAQENLLRSRAQYGLAMTLESQGKIVEAEEAYKTLLELNESKEMDQWVEQRLAALQQPQTGEFAQWFAEQEPASFTPASSPGLPSGDLLPDSPDILAPSVQTPGVSPKTPTIGEQLGTQGEEASDEPLKENPAVEAPPATEAPADAEDGDAVPTTEPVIEVPPVDPPATEEPAPQKPAVEETNPISDGTPAGEEPAPGEPPAPSDDPTPGNPSVEPSGDDQSGGSQ